MPPRGYQKSQNTHKCQYCTYVTHRRSFMNDHVRVHTGEKPFSCGTCAKSFSQKSNLRQHMKVHNQGNPASFQCDLCEFNTKWKSSLQVHDRMHKGEKPYKCKICERAFSQSTHCQTHMREAHLNMRNFQCDICSKTFKRHEHLERHLAFHKEERNFECDICNKKYLDARYLKQHKLIHEGDASKIHCCPLCPYKSRYSQGLKIHTRTHTGIRPYPCTACTKAFVTSQSLKLHHRMVHQGLAGKIFHCDKCTFSTANNQNLKQHVIKIHVGLKDRRSFKCQYCSSMHNNRSSLNSHMASIHPKQHVARSPLKVIGSLSPAKNGLVKVRTSPRALSKLRVKAGSPSQSQVKSGSPGQSQVKSGSPGKIKSESLSPGKFTSVRIKTEPGALQPSNHGDIEPILMKVKKELFVEDKADNLGIQSDGQVNGISRSRYTGPGAGKQCNNINNGSVRSDEEGVMVIDTDEEVNTTKKLVKKKGNKSTNLSKPRATSPSSAKKQRSKKTQNLLKIKLNLPKGSGKIKKDRALSPHSKYPALSNGTVTTNPGADSTGSLGSDSVITKGPGSDSMVAKSPGSDTTVTKSPGSDRGGKKLLKKPVTPSKERARALFVDPASSPEICSMESGVDPAIRDSRWPGLPAADPEMPQLEKQTEAIDYSQSHIRKNPPITANVLPEKLSSHDSHPSNASSLDSHSSNPCVQPSDAEKKPGKHGAPLNNAIVQSTSPAVVMVTRQYESLRDIATLYLNNNTPPTNKSNSYLSDCVLQNGYRDENRDTINKQIKSEPMASDYLTTQPRVFTNQDAALDMRRVNHN